jgi:hypothetical protein
MTNLGGKTRKLAWVWDVSVRFHKRGLEDEANESSIENRDANYKVKKDCSERRGK